MITADQARALIEAELETVTVSDPDLQPVVWRVDEYPRAYVVRVVTRRWLRTRYDLDLMIGAMPPIVEKSTGQVHRLGSAAIAEFQAWLA